VLVRVREGRVSVGTCSAKSVYCPDLFGNVGLVYGHVLRDRVSADMSSAKSDLCRDVIGEVGLMSALLRQGRINVCTCSLRSA